MFFIPRVILAQQGMLNTRIKFCNEYESHVTCITWKVYNMETLWSGGVLLMHLKNMCAMLNRTMGNVIHILQQVHAMLRPHFIRMLPQSTIIQYCHVFTNIIMFYKVPWKT